MLVSKLGSSPKIGIASRTMRSTSLRERVGFRFGAVVVQRDAKCRRRAVRFCPSSTVNVRSVKLLKSVGLSIR